MSGVARVLRVGSSISVDGVEVQIDALYAMMGSDLLSIDEAPRGSIIALGPALSSAFAGKRGALACGCHKSTEGSGRLSSRESGGVFTTARRRGGRRRMRLKK